MVWITQGKESGAPVTDLLRPGGQRTSGTLWTGKEEEPWPFLSYWLTRASELEMTGK